MRVTLLGTGTAIPDANRGPTAVLVEHSGTAVVIDAGSGTLQRLARVGHSPLTIDALLLTHAHLDHVADVLPLVFTFVVPYIRRVAPLPIYGSARTLGFVRAALAVFGDWLDGRGQIEFCEIGAGETVDVGSLRVSTGSVDHDPGSLSWRLSPVDAPYVSVAIPGDSGPCDALVASMRGATLAIVECGVTEANPVEGHLTPTSLAAVAARAGVDRLAIVHRYPPLLFDDTVVDQVLAAGFYGEVLVPDDLDVIEVS
jgi:ribonuclease BN (tRNA processing enzyme)